MEPTILLLIARVIGASAIAAARPAATFFAVQLTVAVLVRMDVVALPAALAWLVSILALGFGFGAAVVELLAIHSDHFEQTLRGLKLDRFQGAFSAFSMALVLAAMGAPESALDADAAGESAADLATAVRLSAESGHPLWLQFAAVLIGLAVNVGLTWLRSTILEKFDDVGITGFWHWFETGGVAVALVLALVAPFLVLFLVVVLTMFGVAFTISLRLVGKAMDARQRRPCPHCGKPIRVEAFLCPSCRQPVAPTQQLGTPATRRLGYRLSRITEAIRFHARTRPDHGAVAGGRP